MPYFAAAYAIIWLVLFAFVFNMNRRLGKLDEELDLLEEVVREKM